VRSIQKKSPVGGGGTKKEGNGKKKSDSTRDFFPGTSKKQFAGSEGSTTNNGRGMTAHLRNSTRINLV